MPEIEHQINLYLGREVQVAVEIATVSSGPDDETKSQHLVAFVFPTQGLVLKSANASVPFIVWERAPQPTRRVGEISSTSIALLYGANLVYTSEARARDGLWQT